MNKLALLALLGMVVVAAAVDAEVQKKHYKKEKEYEGEEKHTEASDYVTPHFKHVEFTVVGNDGKTFPCDAEGEILGATVAYEGGLSYGGKTVGSVFWSGIVVKSAYKDYSIHEKITQINYEVTFEFTTKEYAGQIVAGAVGDSVFSEADQELAILGGTGAFKGASGTITWVGGNKGGTYEFDLYVPKPATADYEYKYYSSEKY